MILIIAVLAILLLIACVGLHVLNEGVKEAQKIAKEHEANWFAETSISSALRNEKLHEWERACIAEEKVISLKTDLCELKQSFKNLQKESDDELGFGSHIKWHSIQKPTAETYRLVFDLDPNGRKIIDELVARFKRNAFTSDQDGGERETSRRLGRSEVIDFILNRCNTANDPRYSEHLEISAMEQNND